MARMGNLEQGKAAEVAVLLKLGSGLQQLKVNFVLALITAWERFARTQHGVMAEAMSRVENAIQARCHDFLTSAEI